MESTLLAPFLKLSKIRRWLTNPDSPPIVWEIKSLYDQMYTPNSVEQSNALLSDRSSNALSFLAIPKDLYPLVFTESKVFLQARLKMNSIIYSTHITHQGNS